MAKAINQDIGKVAVRPMGVWSATESYERLDLVYQGNSTYVSLKDGNAGHAVTDTEWWQRVVDGDTASAAAQSATEAAASANTAADSANKEATEAGTQSARAKTLADNPPKIGENGDWLIYDEASGEYKDSGVLATGGFLTPTFDIDEEGILHLQSEDTVTQEHFAMDEDGILNYEY
jgi:hypothetical protein